MREGRIAIPIRGVFDYDTGVILPICIRRPCAPWNETPGLIDTGTLTTVVSGGLAQKLELTVFTQTHYVGFGTDIPDVVNQSQVELGIRTADSLWWSFGVLTVIVSPTEHLDSEYNILIGRDILCFGGF